MAKDSAAASNQTAEKLLLVLEALARQTQPVKLVDLAHQVGMNQSTCYRFVAALQNAGYAAQDRESGKYILNLKLCSLAEMIKDRVSVTSLLHAFVAEASALFQESAHLVQEENRQIVYIDNVTISSQSLITRQYIGRTAPMYCTGVGKLFLLEYSPEELAEKVWSCGGYCEPVLEEGRLVDAVPGQRPEEAAPEPTAEERLRADVDFLAAVTGVEL